MSGINKVIILGRLGQDPEVKKFDDEGSMTKFSVATSKKWKAKDGSEKEDTQWHNISCFGKLAEIASKYLSKGRQVYIEGELRTRSWEKDGERRYATEIVCERIEFIGDNKVTKSDSSDVTESPKQVALPIEGHKEKKTSLKNYAPGSDDSGNF